MNIPNSWYPVTLAQSTWSEKLVSRVYVRKWLNNSPLLSTFLAKLARSEEAADLLMFLIQKCSKVK